MKVLVLNTGSSSIKYEVFRVSDWLSLASGLVERIGERESQLEHRTAGVDEPDHAETRRCSVNDHHEAMKLIGDVLSESGVLRKAGDLLAVGHRVVHGGEAFREPTLITKDVIDTIKRQSPLAPLHNPANVIGIQAAIAAHPNVPQVAVFDTAFHQTLPRHAYRYAIPEPIYREYFVRRYGFHGTSHFYVAKEAAKYLGQPLAQLNLITLHLGNGASVAAIREGHSIDTSMGLTPLEGLVMGTRCGDIDPAIVFYLFKVADLSIDQIESMLNKESGLKGICGDNDMREILRRSEGGDIQAQLAVDVFAYRVRKYVGAYLAVLGRLDAVVFTAGIGENSPEIRAECCRDLEHLGITCDPRRNTAAKQGVREIQLESGSTKVLVVPTNEELEIAQETVETVASRGANASRIRSR